MSEYDPTAENGSVEQPDKRTRRALSEDLTVFDDPEVAPENDDLYVVVSKSRERYIVNIGVEACDCPDYRYRGARCKHIRRVAFATGRRPIPPAVHHSDIDPDLSRYVDGEPVFAEPDGGRTVVAGADGRSEHATPCTPRGFDRDARRAVHETVRDLLVDDLDHLLNDFYAWDRTVALAGESTVRAVSECVEEA